MLINEKSGTDNNNFYKYAKEAINIASAELRGISVKIHADPELGWQEHHAHALLVSFLEDKGFKVTPHLYNLPTAFRAVFDSPHNVDDDQGHVVAFCSEYDALPGIFGEKAGHACGHNLIAIAGVACALGVKAVLENCGIRGKVVLFGTPAEETSGGKKDIINNGGFDGIDFCMMLHPGMFHAAYPGILAVQSATVEYFGKASHAAGAPWKGINALDAVIQAYNSLSMLRQQTLLTDRIHGIIEEGGKAANVIPDYTRAFFYLRSQTRQQLKDLVERAQSCFEGAARATGCTFKLTLDSVTSNVLSNSVLGDLYTKHIEKTGVILPPKAKQEAISLGSTDMGNVTYVVPGIHPTFKIPANEPNHTQEFATAAGQLAAHRPTLEASIALACVAIDILTDEKLFQTMKKEFENSILIEE